MKYRIKISLQNKSSQGVGISWSKLCDRDNPKHYSYLRVVESNSAFDLQKEKNNNLKSVF